MKNMLWITVFSLSLTTIAGCTSKSSGSDIAASHAKKVSHIGSEAVGDSTDAPGAKLTDDQEGLLQRAQQIIDNIDYLPFHYYYEGCETRAMIMGLELEVAGIPASTVTVRAKKDSGGIWPIATIPQRLPVEPIAERSSWLYHVALVFHTSSGEQVIDPALSKAAVSLDQWFALMGTSRDKVHVSFGPATTWAGGGAGDGVLVTADDRLSRVADYRAVDEENVLRWASTMTKNLGTLKDWPAAALAESARESKKLLTRLMELRDKGIKLKLITPATDEAYVVNAENIDALQSAD